ncbi:hypothetical protein ACRAWD_30005 [Caulobacter segnis]
MRFGNMFNDRSFEGSSRVGCAAAFLERNVVATSIIPQRGFYGISIMPRIFWKSGHASITLQRRQHAHGRASDRLRQAEPRCGSGALEPDQDRIRSILHLGVWGFDEDLAAGGGTLTRNTVIGGRFNRGPARLRAAR